MKTAPLHIIVAIGALLNALMASCAHKPIECPTAATGIEIRFEWDLAPDADVDGMALYFYPLDSHSRIWRFDIAGRDGGRVELPPGTYRMMACNNDLPGTTIEDAGSLSTIRAAAARAVADGVYADTGMLYGAVVSSLEVTPCGVRYTTSAGTVKECGMGLVRCSPDSVATAYTVRIRHVTGEQRARTAYAQFTPVADALLLDSRRPVGEGAWLRVPLDADRQQHTLDGSGCAFGLAPADASACRLSVLVAKTDGKTIARTIEITPENMNIITPHNVMITIDGFDIPDGGTPGSDDVGGFDAAVDGWNVVEIELESATQ